MSTPGFGFKNRKLHVFVEDRIMTTEGDWNLGQLKCHSNAKASAATHQAVESWLDQYALSV